MTLSKTIKVLFTLAITLTPLASEAGLAAFSPDGNTLFVVKNSFNATPVVVSVDLVKKTVRRLSGPDETETLVAIGVGKDSKVLAASKKFVWSLNPSNSGWKQLAKAPTGGRFTGGCMDSKTGDFILTTIQDRKQGEQKEGEVDRIDALSLFEAKRKQIVKVFCRRMNYVSGISCDRNGQLFFGHDYDLWHGVISPDGDGYVLVAYRCAPLAATETSIGNSSGEGLYQVAPTDKHLFVEVSRAGGSGHGSFYRLPRPKDLLIEEEGFAEMSNDSESRYSLYMRMLSEAKLLDGADKAHSMTAAPDGKRVFIIDRGKIEVYSGEEPPETLKITIPE